MKRNRTSPIQDIIVNNKPIRKNIFPTPPFRWLVAARSQMGKTTHMIKVILYDLLDKFDRIYIFCPTYNLDEKWRVMDEHAVGNNPKVIVKGMPTEKAIYKIWKECEERKTAGNKKWQTLIYLDDCTGSELLTDLSNKSCLNQLVSRLNHSNMSLIICIQKITQVSTTVRQQAEVLLTFYTQSQNEAKHLWSEYGTGSFKEFHSMLKATTALPYETFYVNRQGSGPPDFYHNYKFIPT